MPYLTDLATVARKSGLPVVEVPGWKTRGHGPMASVETIVCHHTATSDKAAGDYPTLRIVRDGRPGLPGPLAQLGLGRSGTIYVIAAGRCWHAGATALARQGNSRAIGIEAESSGARPIEGVQLAAYVSLVRVLAAHYRVPIAHVQSHGEVAVPRGRKTDIRNDMRAFRALVAAGKTSPGSSAPAPPKSPAVKPRGPFPLARGSWYGPDDKTSRSHSGKQVRDRTAIRQIQSLVGVTVDGLYGPATRAAVARWQKAHGLTADGLVGAVSWEAMN